MTIRYFFTMMILLLTGVLAAQESTALLQWEAHLPYQQGAWVTQSDDQVIYCSELSVFTIDKQDMSVDFLSKVEGLSDVGVDFVAYDRVSDRLLVVYSNSNMDVVGDEIYNFPEILENNRIQGDKSIRAVSISDEGVAYLSTAFGFIELDMVNLEYGETVFTSNLPVSAVQEHEGKLYIATEDGVYSVPDDGSVNIKDVSNWTLIDAASGLPTLEPVTHLASFNGNLYVSTIDRVFVGEDQFFETIANAPADNFIAYLSSNPSHLALAFRPFSGNRTSMRFYDRQGDFVDDNSGCTSRSRYAVVDELGRPWYADEWEEIRFADAIGGACSKIRYNSPPDFSTSNISTDEDGNVYAASGGATDDFAYNFTNRGFFILKEGRWTTYNQDNVDIIGDRNITNAFDIVPVPNSSVVYMGSYWAGVLEYDTETGDATLHDKDNSSLQGTIGDAARTRVSGLRIDDDGNLWVSNYDAGSPINVRTPDGAWYAYDAPNGKNSIHEIAIDESGYVWMVVSGADGGVVVYDPGEDVTTAADDRSRFISLSNSEISTGQVLSVAVDLDGDVWVGTAEGPVVFECGAGVFEDGCIGDTRLVLQDSIPAILLATEQIRTIAVDGANRKWFGTRNGIFVQSPDGETQEARYTSDNSPLFDNTISDMHYDGVTGKMWVSTDQGLQAIRTTTTEGERRHTPGSVYAFPNPVEPGYQGPIAIKGLVTDADVKITDLNGRLVFETTALGGQAVWDGTDYSGRRVDTGVYLVFSAGAVGFDEVDSYVTKIMFIR